MLSMAMASHSLLPFLPATQKVDLSIKPPLHWHSKRFWQHGQFYYRIKLEQNRLKICSLAPFLDDRNPQCNAVPSSTKWRILPDIWRTCAEKYGDRVALFDHHHQPSAKMTYAELEQEISVFAEAVRIAGSISSKEKVALFADNSNRWLVADQGIMASGAINVVRGSRSSIDELLHIYIHSDSVALVIDNVELYNKLVPKLKASANFKFIVLLWGERSMLVDEHNSVIYTYHEFLAKGRESCSILASKTWFEDIQPYDVATIVYTSGATGNPKGVMLTHANILHQVLHFEEVTQPSPGDRYLSLLPPWHMYERSAEYFCLSHGMQLVYTNAKSIKEDIKHNPPDYFVSVPLVFGIFYRRIQKQFSSVSNRKKLIAFSFLWISTTYMRFRRIYQGKNLATTKKKPIPVIAGIEWLVARLVAMILLPLHMLGKIVIYSKIYAAFNIRKAAINGGGSLPRYLDEFFEAIGITVLNGYGLTECSPVVSCRSEEDNVIGTVGKPLSLTEIKVVNPASDEILPDGEKGLVKVRGPQVMKGYYKNDAATHKVLDNDGWLDTGDLGRLIPNTNVGAARSCGGHLVLEGRLKDTIVLSTGENAEPAEIEEAALQSRLIEQIMVVGQDQRRLGALVVPNKEELKLAASEMFQAQGIAREPIEEDFRALIRKDLERYTANCSQTVGPFLLIDEAFTIESGLLTPTMKLKRDAIASRYSSQIQELYT